jgi:hypothetical protein
MSSGRKSKLLRLGDRRERVPSPVQALITIASLGALLEIGSGCGVSNSNGPTLPPSPGGPVTVQEVLIRKHYVSGIVKQIEGSDLTIELVSGGGDPAGLAGASQTFSLTPKTLYYRAGTAISLADIKVGEEVWVKAKESQKTGGLVVQEVLSGVRGELPAR